MVYIPAMRRLFAGFLLAAVPWRLAAEGEKAPAFPVAPRMAQALRLAAQELRAAEEEARTDSSGGPAREAARRDLARARAWSAALRGASAAALPQDSDVVVSAVKGGGELTREGRGLKLRSGILLRDSDQVATAEGAAELRFHDGALLALSPGSRLRVLQAPRSFPAQAGFSLDRGALYWRSSAVSPDQVRVVTPRAAARLGSGAAELAIDADGTARLSVLEGSSELSARSDGASSPRTAGGWWEELYR